MRCVKTVTPIKIHANRKNAKRSTGPRSERGKCIARFNAVTLGPFADHVVIPICDGYKPEKDFQSLLDGLPQQFQPLGLYEEWLVVTIAECMWRLRRATRCESGSVRESAIWAVREASMIRVGRYDDNRDTLEFIGETRILTEAEEQIQNSGTLSQMACEHVVPLVEKERSKKIQSVKPVGTNFDREEFLNCISARKEFFESYRRGLGGRQRQSPNS